MKTMLRSGILFAFALTASGCGGCSDGSRADNEDSGTLGPAGDDGGGQPPEADGGGAQSDAGSQSDAGAEDGSASADASEDATIDGAADAGVDARVTVETAFVYDDQERLLGEYSAAGSARQEIIYVDGRAVAVVRDGKVYAVQTDQLGAPRVVMASGAALDAGAVVDAGDDAGDVDGSAPDATPPAANIVVWRWDPEPFGATAPDEDPDGNGERFSFHERFPGQRLDPVSGLYQNHHRNYSPELGRYVEADPRGLAAGPNLYAYVGGNPVANVDPKGLEKCVAGTQHICIENIERPQPPAPPPAPTDPPAYEGKRELFDLRMCRQAKNLVSQGVYSCVEDALQDLFDGTDIRTVANKRRAQGQWFGLGKYFYTNPPSARTACN